MYDYIRELELEIEMLEEYEKMWDELYFKLSEMISEHRYGMHPMTPADVIRIMDKMMGLGE